MKFTLFLTHYLVWHYSAGIRGFLVVWKDFLWFAYNFFSIPLLLRTLFSPFQRLGEDYKRGLDLEALASTLIVNTIMRFVGFFARSFVIVLGLASIVFVIAAGATLFVVWLMMPFFIFSLVVLSLYGLINMR